MNYTLYFRTAEFLLAQYLYLDTVARLQILSHVLCSPHFLAAGYTPLQKLFLNLYVVEVSVGI